MATTHPLPPPAVAPEAGSEIAGNQPSPSQALVPVPPGVPELASPAGVSRTVALLPVELDVAVPVRGFRVRDLLALAPGLVIETVWGNGDDVPLAAGDVQLAWSEFEVVETQLAVRVTRLA